MRFELRAAVALALALVALVAGPSPVLADDPAPKDASEGADARRFFSAGQKAFAEGRYVDAARAFEEAVRLKPHPAPLINAGDAWQKAGEYALAARAFQRVLTMEQATEQDRADAVDRLATLKPQLGEIELIGDAGVKVRVDDEEFHGGDKVYVFPGEHRVTLADVERAKVRALRIEANTVRSVELAALQAPADTAAVATAEPSAPIGESHNEASPIGIPTMIAYGVGVVGFAGFAVFGLRANAAASDFDAKYERGEPNRDEYDRYNQSALIANVALGFGIVGAGVGTFFLVRDLKNTPRKRTGRIATVELVPRTGGAALSFHGNL